MSEALKQQPLRHWGWWRDFWHQHHRDNPSSPVLPSKEEVTFVSQNGKTSLGVDADNNTVSMVPADARTTFKWDAGAQTLSVRCGFGGPLTMCLDAGGTGVVMRNLSGGGGGFEAAQVQVHENGLIRFPLLGLQLVPGSLELSTGKAPWVLSDPEPVGPSLPSGFYVIENNGMCLGSDGAMQPCTGHLWGAQVWGYDSAEGKVWNQSTGLCLAASATACTTTSGVVGVAACSNPGTRQFRLLSQGERNFLDTRYGFHYSS